MSQRTFQVKSSHMEGADIKLFQGDVEAIFASLDIDYPLKADGDYGVASRSAIASLCHALGYDAGDLMRNGVTPWLRTKIRERRRTVKERVAFAARVNYRRALRRKFANKAVAPMVSQVVADSWGYHPPGHDGLDVITKPNAPIYAMCDARVIRADSGGWWGQNPSGDVALGDGIIVLECLTDKGPFKKHLRICYGHAEKATVKVGERVEAGQMIGHAGKAVAWHIHLMIHGRKDARGKGDRDPRPFYAYAQRQR